MEEEFYLVDSATTNTILSEIKYFQTLTKSKGNVTTITGRNAVIVDVDDLNIIGNTRGIDDTCNHLKTEFEMKDLGKIKFYLGFKA
jgi:hypothetical protein